MEFSEVSVAIGHGELDESLELVLSSVRERQRYLKEVNARSIRSTLKVGDTVRLTGLRPKALEGAEVEVVELPAKSNGRIAVQIPQFYSYGRWSGKVAKVTATMIQEVVA